MRTNHQKTELQTDIYAGVHRQIETQPHRSARKEIADAILNVGISEAIGFTKFLSGYMGSEFLTHLPTHS